ncbi:MAG: hypothetical protein J6E46_06155 [Faecalicoccus sp.]|nr:hypothetical protein [Faecalicoccus sp.]
MEKKKEAEAAAQDFQTQPGDNSNNSDITGDKVGNMGPTVCYKKQGPIRYLLPVLITFASMYLRIFDYVFHYQYDSEWNQWTTYYDNQMFVRIGWYVVFAALFLIWTVVSPIERIEPEKDIISGKKKWFILIVLEYTLFVFIHLFNLEFFLYRNRIMFLFCLMIEIGIVALLFWQR